VGQDTPLQRGLKGRDETKYEKLENNLNAFLTAVFLSNQSSSGVAEEGRTAIVSNFIAEDRTDAPPPPVWPEGLQFE
jgi:hypothetical protein